MFATLSLSFLPLLAAIAKAHRPHIDDGTHTSMSNAWTWPDTNYARDYMMNFECPSSAIFTKVYINDTKPHTFDLGVPNITSIYDFRPTLWIVGKTLSIPPEYNKDDVSKHNTASTEVPGFKPYVPQGFTTLEYPSEGSDLWHGGGEASVGISFYTYLSVNVTVEEPGDVWAIVQPTENRRARVFMTLGHNEQRGDEEGESNQLDMKAWHSPTSWPTIGWKCEPWDI